MQSAGPGVLITDSAELAEYLQRGDTNSATGARVTPDTSMRVAAVYGCVRIIAGKVATLPIDVKRRVDERTREDANDHPLAIVLRRRPNGWMKPAAFRRMLQTHILLRGNAYCRIVRGVRGDLQALLPLHPDRVTPKQQPDLSIRYEYQPPNGAAPRTFAQEEILHLMGLTLDGIVGVSVLTYARESVGLSIALRDHGATFFRNGANIGSVVRHPARLGSEALANMRASLDDYQLGGARSGKTLVLEEGAEFSVLGMSAQDAQFVESIKATRTDIAMFFGVPPHMLGDTEKSTTWGAGIEQQSLGFVAYTLEDWLTCWEEGCNGDLLTPAESDLYARFNRNALVRGDIKTRWGAYATAMQWGVNSPNEIRALEDENPRDGGDVYYDPPNTAGTAAADNAPNGSNANDPAQAA